MNNSNENSAVKIAVRERPVRDNLKGGLQHSVVTYHPNGNSIIVNEAVFTFDHVLGPTINQKDIFDKLIKPLVKNLKLGFNCTALAYGQTGTGKSYTMGLNSKSFDGDDVGVIPRCLREIFSTIEVNSENQENYENVLNSILRNDISVSFIEIYNEKVYDLLGDNTKEPIVAKGYKYTGGTRKPLKNLEDCYNILLQGNKNRHVRPTIMNSESSRSHAIFTIHVRSRAQKVNGEESVTTSCMNIVDLAGSEGVRRTGHQGLAMSEGVHINQGLLSIGKVLQALATGSKLIPYRDSVLSFVLQESLNSNSYLTLLACISPHREDLSETLSTLRFAQNAKQLKNAPEVNNITADIRRNIKLKQTPYKVKSVKQLFNTRPTPLKQPKSSVKSNTFCTPKKRRIEVNKVNRTEISSNYKRPTLSNVAINLPKMNQLESTHNRESIFNRSLDSNGSLPSLNLSTLTATGDHAKTSNTTNFSPIIRKCMTELKNDLQDNMLKMLQNNLPTFVLQTPAPAASLQNEIILPYTIRQELKNIMKEILSERSAQDNAEEVQQNQQTTLISAQRELYTTNDELFKVPKIPLEFNRPVTSSPINKESSGSSNSFIQHFFPSHAFTDKTALRKTINHSYSISEKQQQKQSICSIDTVVINTNQLLRRSARQSVLQMYENKCQKEERSENTKNTKNVKKFKNTTKENVINNTTIDSYCNRSTSTSTKKRLTKHRKAVLDLLNKGSMKELQILPQVGQKTAYQIVTQRTLTGKFKSLVQVEKLPIWRGSAWERFAKSNMLI